MQKTEFIVIIGIVQSYLAKWWERLNFSNIDGENIRKSIREKKVEWCDWEEEKMNFGNDITKIHSTAQALPVKCPSGSARMIYQLWQPSCRNCRELRREKIWIVATKLPKMGGKKKWLSKSEEELKKKSVTSIIFLQYFYNKSQVISCY